jgi:capsular polysaccharide export protein
VFPLSLCFDHSGIYYDSTRPSDLETLLETATFTTQELERAARLRQRIVDAGVSKYNLSSPGRPDALRAAGRKVVVAFSQVPDDESLQLGGGEVMSNLDFLARVRAERPDAYLVFKEHPDLASGKRAGATDLRAAGAIADTTMSCVGDALRLDRGRRRGACQDVARRVRGASAGQAGALPCERPSTPAGG